MISARGIEFTEDIIQQEDRCLSGFPGDQARLRELERQCERALLAFGGKIPGRATEGAQIKIIPMRTDTSLAQANFGIHGRRQGIIEGTLSATRNINN